MRFGVLNVTNGNIVDVCQSYDDAQKKVQEENEQNPECIFMSVPL